ncbi:Stk1 family PASTA domain-containing Ser/Thr kinase [Lysinibacillus sp. 54212]|uniref:Stk1 family PASTA domain-containing Ser/Thr kinase n=1 Tax=Lysinibacillus sp. 54212 TaxID=3119829 RepID=UPI002FC83EB3
MFVGKRVSDRYKILELIGGGGMSHVYLAHDMILNRDVAIKILRYDFTNEAELHRRFQREALSATSLSHPNIVSVYDVGEDGDMHYIVMEYIKGKTLKQYIQEFSPLSPARSVHIMKQLTSAIAHAHENGIIHRDIKPQNILVDDDGNVKITDFGIATTLNATSYTQTNSVMGTVHYLSPEQARGGIATNKSDIYSLGIVLYELLTGELPFSGESAVSIALKHLQSETPSVRAFDATIPQSIENIVLKATAKDANHRYESVEDLEEDLASVLSPGRANELKYMPPLDDEATKAIPIIKENLPINDMMQTKMINKVQEGSKPETPKATPSLKKPKKKKWPIIVGTIIGLAVIIVIAIFALTPSKIEIPDVTNHTIEEATKMLEEAGFVVGKEEERHSEEIEEGNVIGTDPEAGKTRVEGSEINLIVSIGHEPVEMENYEGRDIDQVMTILENDEYEDIDIEYEYSDDEVGTIIAQYPAAGEEIIVKNTTITFTVSKGKNTVSVANLKGYNESALNEYERSSGFIIKEVSTEYSDTVPAGSVISQKPSAGTKLEEGSTIQVVISKGPKQKLVKFYKNTVVIPYEPEEPEEEQEVRIYISDKTNTMEKPIEVFSIMENTRYGIQLEVEEGKKASYRIERDGVIIEQKEIHYDDLKS